MKTGKIPSLPKQLVQCLLRETLTHRRNTFVVTLERHVTSILKSEKQKVNFILNRAFHSDLFVLRFYGPVNTIKVMSSNSINLGRPGMEISSTSVLLC